MNGIGMSPRNLLPLNLPQISRYEHEKKGMFSVFYGTEVRIRYTDEELTSIVIDRKELHPCNIST